MKGNWSYRYLCKLFTLLSLFLIMGGVLEYYHIFLETTGEIQVNPWGKRNMNTPPLYHWIQTFTIGSIVNILTLFSYSPKTSIEEKNHLEIIESEFINLKLFQFITGISFWISIGTTYYSSIQLKTPIDLNQVYTPFLIHKLIFMTYFSIYLFITWFVISKRLKKYYKYELKLGHPIIRKKVVD